MKIIIIYIIKVLSLPEITFTKKIDLLLSAWLSLFRLILLRQRKVKYFGNNFIHESLVGPVLTYPYEVSANILRQVLETRIQYVLDIGGNVGQFSITMVNMTKVKQIDVLEPNPEIYSLLEQNTKYYPQINLFNVGVGKKGSRTFYFKEHKSSTGSIVKSNANDDQSSLKKIKINLTDNLAGMTKRSKYDLIKIDVEGSEYEVIENLKGVETKYLYMEISANREKSFLSSDIFVLIEKRLGKFNILWQEETNNKSVCYNTLLGFPKD